MGKKMAPNPTTLNITVFSFLYISFESCPLVYVLLQIPMCIYISCIIKEHNAPIYLMVVGTSEFSEA